MQEEKEFLPILIYLFVISHRLLFALLHHCPGEEGGREVRCNATPYVFRTA